MFDYDKNAQKAAQTLDQYDFSKTLKDCHSVPIPQIVSSLELYGKKVSDAFAWLTADEIATYLKLRYGMRIQEIYEFYASWDNNHKQPPE